MALIQINADLSQAIGWLKRIAEALERAYPKEEKARFEKRGIESLSQMGESPIPQDDLWRTYGPRSNYTRELPLPPEQ